MTDLPQHNRPVLLFSIAVGQYSELFASCILTQREYARQHGYTYVLIDQAPRPLLPTEASWLKIPLIKAAIESHYEWVGFVDADCDISAHAPPFVDVFSKLSSDKCMFMAHGFSGRINAGVIFAKNRDGAKSLLESIIDNSDKPVAPEDCALYENGHVIAYAKDCNDVMIVDWNKWNNNRELNSSSYIQHFSGGMLREWYMANRAPEAYRRVASTSFASRVYKKVMRRLRVGRVRRSSAPVISQSLKELMPYYREQYREFA